MELQPEPAVLLTQKQVMRLVGIGSRETLSRWVRRGQFPPPIVLAGGGLRWLRSEVENWITREARARDISRNAHAFGRLI